MKIKNILSIIGASALLATSLISCSEDALDKVNKDLNHTTAVPARLIITDVMTKTAFSVVGGDFNAYLSSYVEHETGTHNQFYRAEKREGEPSSSATFNNVWGSTYTTLKDAKMVIEQCSEGGSEPKNVVTRGIAKVLLAYNLAVLTDMYGDTPWKEAGDYTVSMTPVIDKQEAIYADILANLDSAIEDLRGTDLIGITSQDFIYKGDADLWMKTAYGLKARYTMRLMKRSADVNVDMQKVLDYVSKSYTSADEQCSYDMYQGSNINPMFGIFWARAGISASQSLFDKLVARKDPRIARCFMDPNKQEMIASVADPLLKLPPNGDPIQSQLAYTNSIFVASQSAPTHLLSYHEVLFLKAEALSRLNKKDDAKTVLKEAVVAGMVNAEKSIKSALESSYWGGFTKLNPAITPEDAATYFDASVAPLFDANPLKETMNQKYLALWGANGESIECYNDVRRLKALGEDFIELKNPNKFPLRCAYGNDDTTTNPNVKAAYGDGQYVYTEAVWWAGGER